MLEVAARLILAAILAASAIAKLARPAESRAALATYGFRAGGERLLAWTVLVGAELALAVGVAVGSVGAAYAAGALMLVFAGTLGSAVIRGRAGEPCACFGGGGTVGGWAIARNLGLAAAFFALAALG